VVLGVALLVLFALLSLSSPGAALGSQRLQHTVLGLLGAAAVVFVLLRAGLPWLALGIPLLWSLAEGRRSTGGRTRSTKNAIPPAAPAPSTGPMTRDEALQVLGLEPGAPKERILSQYRNLMKKVHPDVGGTTYLAARLNEAKDTLLGG
jgi:hypothetical protein